MDGWIGEVDGFMDGRIFYTFNNMIELIIK